MKNNMKITLLILASALTTKVALGECDCTIIPYNPPSCFSECAGRLLAKASYHDLVVKLSLTENVSQKIVTFDKRNQATSLNDYKKVLSGSEIAGIEARFKQNPERVAAVEKEHSDSVHVNPR